MAAARTDGPFSGTLVDPAFPTTAIQRLGRGDRHHAKRTQTVHGLIDSLRTQHPPHSGSANYHHSSIAYRRPYEIKRSTYTDLLPGPHNHGAYRTISTMADRRPLTSFTVGQGLEGSQAI